MSELKTKPTKASVKKFIESVESESKRKDAFTLLELFARVTGEKAVLWGTEHHRVWQLPLQIDSQQTGG